MPERRRDDLGRHPEYVAEDPSQRAHEERLANARLARSIAAEQTLSGSNTRITASRFDPERVRSVIVRDQSGRLTVRWDRVEEGDLGHYR